MLITAGGKAAVPPTPRAAADVFLLFLGSVCCFCCLSSAERQLTPALGVLFRNEVIQANQFIFSALARFIL